MIDKDRIAAAVRDADAAIEEHGDMPAFFRERGVDMDGLGYVAMQRGLRAVMMDKGMDPTVPPATPIALTREESRRQMMYAGLFMDGFAAGRDVAESSPCRDAGK